MYVSYVTDTPKISKLRYITAGPNISENSSIKLSCEVESYPKSTILWFYENNRTVPLKTDNNVMTSIFTLKDADCFDTGFYTCVAYNGLGPNVTSALPINVFCEYLTR